MWHRQGQRWSHVVPFAGAHVQNAGFVTLEPVAGHAVAGVVGVGASRVRVFWHTESIAWRNKSGNTNN